MRRPAPATVRWGLLAAILLLWELVPATGIVPELFLPSLSKTLTVLIEDRQTYFAALLVTLYEVAFAMLIACGAGIVAGALVGGLTLLRNLLLPVFSSLYAVPIVILYPVEDKTMPTGELGEICIAGVGLALGYLTRDELTMKKFIRDFLNIQNNPSGRIYRTGDLGRIDENGEIEYRGRIDTQVKIRGYRIELNEI